MFCCSHGGDAPERVFGADIKSMAAEDMSDNVPKVLKETAAYVREYGMTKEGIFRRSANHQKLKEVKAMYNNGDAVDFNKMGGVHMAANVMKTFLRDLRIPLMGFSIYPTIMKISSDGNLNDRIAACQSIFTSHIPGRNLTILRALVFFLNEVSTQSASNGMTGSNVAIVFGPNLLWAKGSGPGSTKVPSVEEMNKVAAFTQFMFDNSKALFHNMNADGYDEQVL